MALCLAIAHLRPGFVSPTGTTSWCAGDGEAKEQGVCRARQTSASNGICCVSVKSPRPLAGCRRVPKVISFTRGRPLTGQRSDSRGVVGMRQRRGPWLSPLSLRAVRLSHAPEIRMRG